MSIIISNNIFIKPKRFVNKVFLHCSANSNPKWGINELRESHLARGFSDIGYHYFIDFEGNLFKCRPLEKIPAAQKGYNTGSIAICLHGGQNNKDDFTKEQHKTLAELCEYINNVYENKITFHGHCEVDEHKFCPVFDYQQILNLVDSYLIKIC